MKVFISTHGHMASGIQSAVRILAGDSENLTVFDSYVSDEKLDDILKNYFESTAEEEQVVMVSDLYGGSVNSIMYPYLKRKNTYLVSGVNLMFILDLLMKDHVDRKQLENMIKESCQLFKLVTLENNDETGETVFF